MDEKTQREAPRCEAELNTFGANERKARRMERTDNKLLRKTERQSENDGDVTHIHGFSFILFLVCPRGNVRMLSHSRINQQVV